MNYGRRIPKKDILHVHLTAYLGYELYALAIDDGTVEILVAKPGAKPESRAAYTVTGQTEVPAWMFWVTTVDKAISKAQKWVEDQVAEEDEYAHNDAVVRATMVALEAKKEAKCPQD